MPHLVVSEEVNLEQLAQEADVEELSAQNVGGEVTVFIFETEEEKAVIEAALKNHVADPDFGDPGMKILKAARDKDKDLTQKEMSDTIKEMLKRTIAD